MPDPQASWYARTTPPSDQTRYRGTQAPFSVLKEIRLKSGKGEGYSHVDRLHRRLPEVPILRASGPCRVSSAWPNPPAGFLVAIAACETGCDVKVRGFVRTRSNFSLKRHAAEVTTRVAQRCAIVSSCESTGTGTLRCSHACRVMVLGQYTHVC